MGGQAKGISGRIDKKNLTVVGLNLDLNPDIEIWSVIIVTK